MSFFPHFIDFSPYFGVINPPAGSPILWTGTSGGYSAVYQQFPEIDYLFIQEYNQVIYSIHLTCKGK
jgi:hypothetical protein